MGRYGKGKNKFWILMIMQKSIKDIDSKNLGEQEKHRKLEMRKNG